MMKKYYGALLRAEGIPDDTVTALLEGLGTLGVLEYHSGTEKPGWDAFMEIVREVY